MTPTTIIASLVLFIFGVVYAVIVRHLRSRDYDHGQTPLLVVVGVGVVIGVFGLITEAEMAILLLLLFAAAGMPLIAEYVDNYTDRLRRLRIAASITGEE